MLPLTSLLGHCTQIPLHKRVCSSDQKSVAHVVLYCPLLETYSERLLNPILQKHSSNSEQGKLKILLSDTDKFVTFLMARFIFALLKMESVSSASIN